MGLGFGFLVLGRVPHMELRRMLGVILASTVDCFLGRHVAEREYHVQLELWAAHFYTCPKTDLVVCQGGVWIMFGIYNNISAPKPQTQNLQMRNRSIILNPYY